MYMTLPRLMGRPGGGGSGSAFTTCELTSHLDISALPWHNAVETKYVSTLSGFPLRQVETA